MTVAADCELLVKALLATPHAAEAYWQKWRREVNPDAMSEDCVRLLPMLTTRYPSWLTDDPARNLMLGLAKRAWTGNQLMMRSVVEAVSSLVRAGIPKPVIAGPAAWALQQQRGQSFRPIFFLELLVSREHVLTAAGALSQLGWVPAPGQVLPREADFDYMEGVWLRNPAGEGLKLTWRLFPAPPERAAEWEGVTPLEEADFQGVRLWLPSRQAMLADALAGSRDGDLLDWRCDAACLLNSGVINWDRLKRWIQFSPAARIKLQQLGRETDVAIPLDLRRRPARVWFQYDLVRSDYRRHASANREEPSVAGLLRYLCERWQTPVWQMPFRGLFYLIRYTFGSPD